MAGDILGIGVSGLSAAQRQLATTSHNVSNVNTEGYSRQRAELEARIPEYFGTGYIGTGVTVQTTVRLANEFLEKQIREANSSYGQYDSFYALSAQIDNILANPDTGLTPGLESFYSALQEANDNPSSTSARQVLLTEADILTNRFQLIDNRLTELNSEVNNRLYSITTEVSDAAASIARLNTDIVRLIGAGQGDMPNDLIDQREVLIKEMAKKTDISVVYQDDGAVNIFIGSGQAMVLGGVASRLTTETNQYNAENLDVILSQGSGTANITNFLSGGELQGILDFKQQVLEPSRNSLGRIAIALSEEMNAQHRLGMTIQGNEAPFPLGGDFFTDLSGPYTALGNADNTGQIEFQITDSQVLSTSNYQLNLTAGQYSLTKLDDTTVNYTAGSIAALNTAMSAIEGFSLIDPPAILPVDGDSFLIRPTAQASSFIGVVVNNVLDIALASPVIAGELTNADGSAVNSGTGGISLPVINTTAANGILTDSLTSLPISLSFETTNPNTFDINLPVDATVSYIDSAGNPQTLAAPVAQIPFDPLTDFAGINYTINYISGDSISFIISGKPDTDDAFVISENTSPFDDNRNGLLMAALQTTKTIENGSSDFQGAYGILVSDVGIKTHAAEVDVKAQQTLLEHAIATRESYSGVNLDEEAALLMEYQQAYQASAKVISAADDMFQVLIGAV